MQNITPNTNNINVKYCNLDVKIVISFNMKNQNLKKLLGKTGNHIQTKQNVGYSLTSLLTTSDQFL